MEGEVPGRVGIVALQDVDLPHIEEEDGCCGRAVAGGGVGRDAKGADAGKTGPRRTRSSVAAQRTRQRWEEGGRSEEIL